ncbi:MAG: cyclic nucleotide-binding domain-containing protein [Microcystaceae cyanobacterium]
MINQVIEQTLKKTQFSQAFKPQELKKLIDVAKLKTFPSGSFLMTEGSPSDSLMIVVAGEIELDTRKTQHHISQLTATSKGLVIGELGLLLDEPRTANIKAVCDCQAIVFSKDSLYKFWMDGESLITTLALELGQSLGQKVHVLLDEVIDLFNEHDQLLNTIDKLKHSSSQDNLATLKEDLLKQAKNLRQSQQKVQKKLYSLDTEIQHTKTTRRVAEIVIALAVGSVVTLVLSLVGSQLINRRMASKQTPAPAIIPYVTTEEECQKRFGSRWNEGQCWDYEHDPQW